MRPEELQAILNAHPYVRVERPPQLWAPDVDDERFIRLLGEMIAAALVRNGGDLSEITLNVSNVTVEPEAAGSIPEGEFVALTIRSSGDWQPEVTWLPRTAGELPLVNTEIEAAAVAGRAAYGYSRVLPGGAGSVTVFFSRV
jgi:hypothetical protein